MFFVSNNDMRQIALVVPLIMTVLLVGCTQQQYAGTTVQLPGHEPQVYEFSFPVEQTLGIPVDDPFIIKQLIDHTTAMTFVFDGSDIQDNGRFQTALFNIVAKLRPYYFYEANRTLGADSFRTWYFVDQDGARQWYNSAGETVAPPVLAGPVVWLKGPATGATETAVRLNSNIIYISGVTSIDVARAADRFVLAVFGIP